MSCRRAARRGVDELATVPQTETTQGDRSVAPPRGRSAPGATWRRSSAIVVALYSLVFFTGDGQPTPKLGIDLQGGTRVTLHRAHADGGEPPREQLIQAQQIIDQRVNGLGVIGAEVVLDGSNITITVPGQDGEQARSLGQTAQLRFRSVLGSVAGHPGRSRGSAAPAAARNRRVPPTSGAPAPTAEPACVGSAAGRRRSTAGRRRSRSTSRCRTRHRLPPRLRRPRPAPRRRPRPVRRSLRTRRSPLPSSRRRRPGRARIPPSRTPPSPRTLPGRRSAARVTTTRTCR